MNCYRPAKLVACLTNSYQLGAPENQKVVSFHSSDIQRQFSILSLPSYLHLPSVADCLTGSHYV